jgi:hypothetical protein
MIASTSIFAQVTINRSSIITGGKVVEQFTDTTSSGISIQTGSITEKTWDFSSLKKGETDTLPFYNVGSKPIISALVPEANLIAEDDESYLMLRLTDTSFVVIGIVEDTGAGPLSVTKINFPLLRFPLTTGTTFSDTSNFDLGRTELGFDLDGPGGPLPFIDSMEITFIQNTEITGKGYGKLKLANGEINNVLMVETITYTQLQYKILVASKWSNMTSQIATMMGIETGNQDTSYSHDWWNSEMGNSFPVVSYNFEEGDTKASYINFSDGTSQATNLANHQNIDITIYPNPTANVIMFKNVMDFAAVVLVKNMSGQTVLKTHLIDSKLDLSNLRAGTYIISLQNMNEIFTAQITKE